MKRNRIYIVMLFFCMLVMGGCRQEPQMEIQQTENLEETEKAENLENEKTEVSETKIYVQVSGAVVSPGVYELAEGSRIFEAVALAGGITEDADASQINQAQKLSDGEMIYIKYQGEEDTQGIVTEQQTDERINLNTATEEQLMTLPGIGQAKAKSIIAWREANGGFTQIEDLMKIEGIKEGIYSKIESSIRVN